MSAPSPAHRLASFEACRRDLVTLAYRMLGDMGRAEDMVQEAWLRWSGHSTDADSPRAYLITVVTRLCLNELDSARARREESRADRLPEPVALDDAGMQVEEMDQVSMALLVVLQRLKPAERAVLLLHDVFDLAHDQIGELLHRSVPACRKLLERARRRVAEERRVMTASPDEHGRLLQAFLAAASAGDVKGLVGLLADDAVMISDGGPHGVSDAGGFRNLPRPLLGAARIAAFVAAATARNTGVLRVEERELNGRPAIVFWRGDGPFAALLVAVGDGKIHRVFFHADTARLRYIDRRS